MRVSDVLPMGLCRVCEIMFAPCHTHTHTKTYLNICHPNKPKVPKNQVFEIRAHQRSHSLILSPSARRLIKGLGIASLKKNLRISYYVQLDARIYSISVKKTKKGSKR